MNRRPQNKIRGFTLIETLLAVVILATALLLLNNSWSGSFLRIRKTQQQFEVAALLERKITDIQLEYRGKSLDEIPEERSDDFGQEYPQYSWKMKSKKLEIPDISSTLTAQEGGADVLLMSVVKQLTEGLSKAIKEVTVTVIYKTPNKGKPLEYSVTTYFIDYDKDIQMGMPSG
ncbi:MAG: general secretion pathway protein GspI [Bdellovibrio sp. CG10_big_fil_rev_8_21_14_0_10_47_8]|nr:MAG: general secretion pathway protein GspI [Bdellovibrio sp. CG10_big_fil_rev_8_21_14_0_10_47_8]